MDIFKTFATDAVKEVEGVWNEVGDGGSVLVARSGNRRFARALSKAVEKNQTALDAKNDAADDLSDSIMVEVMAQTILLDFKGLTFKGQPLTYSEAAAKTLLAVKDFRKLVSALSADFDKYRATQEEALLKS